MKKLLVSLMAVSILATLSAVALEKPVFNSKGEIIDEETYRIEQLLAQTRGSQLPESSKVAQLKAYLAELKEKAKTRSAEQLQKLNRSMTDLEAAIKSYGNK